MACSTVSPPPGERPGVRLNFQKKPLDLVAAVGYTHVYREFHVYIRVA